MLGVFAIVVTMLVASPSPSPASAVQILTKDVPWGNDKPYKYTLDCAYS